MFLFNQMKMSVNKENMIVNNCVTILKDPIYALVIMAINCKMINAHV